MAKARPTKCAVPRCPRTPVHSWVIAGDGATYEVNLCNEDAAPMLALARLGTQLTTPAASEAELSEKLWWPGER